LKEGIIKGEDMSGKNWTLTKENSDLLIRYMIDMELGLNTSKGNKKGGRSSGRLVVLKNVLIQLFKMFEKQGITDVTKITERQITSFVHELYTGKITRQDGQPYSYAVQFVSNFKSFWHWYMKINRKEGISILDICEDLELKNPETKFVYITKEDLEKMLPYFKYEEQVLAKFLFDSIIRFPTECGSLKVKDIFPKDNGNVEVHVSESISKTIGREFNLVYCGEDIIKYIADKKLKDDDYLFNINANTSGQFNKKLKQVAVQVLGDGISHPKAQGKYSEISAYDFRHSGTIWWRIKAQENGRISLDSIRQRGGWSDDEMLNYYTKFIGLTGQIKREDLLTEDDKNNLQKDIDEMKKDLKIATSDSEKEKLFNEVYEAVLNRIMEEKGAKKHWIKKAEEEQVYF